MKAIISIALITFVLIGGVLSAQQKPRSSVIKLPVKEITIFKDGHVFVLHEGELPVDARGNASIDNLPSPVLGTFWPFSSDKKIPLRSVTSSQQIVPVERTALNIYELLLANPGSEVIITEKTEGDRSPQTYKAVIIGVPERNSDELAATDPPDSRKSLPVKGHVIMLKTNSGTKITTIDRILDITFTGEYKKIVSNDEFRNRLMLGLDWGKTKPADKVSAGYMYLQKGIRWFPHYRITLDGAGTAKIRFQATLLNELADLDDATAHLVIGVPNFAFKDITDPISLQENAVLLSSHFRSNARSGYALSNAIMEQSVQADLGGAAAPINFGPEISESQKAEDMYIFSVKHITLKKSERMVIPVKDYTFKYQDVYALDIPLFPPREVTQNFNSQQQTEVAKLLSAPKVMHKVRIKNDSETPFTTSPALIFSGEKLLSQGMMKYTSIGAHSTIDITTAVDINVKKDEIEVERKPNAAKWLNYDYARIDLKGTLKLTNYKNKRVTVEVSRYVLGNVDTAGSGGVIVKTNMIENSAKTDLPEWWNWYSWPQWWSHFNGIGQIKWTVTIEPNKTVELNYAWHYFWR